MSFKALNVCFLAVLIPVYVTGQCLSDLKSLPSYSTKSPIHLKTSTTISGNVSNPIVLFNGVFNLLSVQNKGFTFEAYVNEAIDNTSITGGVLCNKKYKFHKIIFHINQRNAFGRSGNTINGKGFPIEANVVYYDPKYKSFGEALGKPAGIVQVINSVVVGPKPNLAFAPFRSLLLTGVFTKPNSTAKFPSQLISLWLDALQFNPTYYAFIGSYYGVDHDTLFPGAINIIPAVTRSFISYSQYRAFRKVRGTNGRPIQSVTKVFPQGNRPVYKERVGFFQAPTNF